MSDFTINIFDAFCYLFRFIFSFLLFIIRSRYVLGFVFSFLFFVVVSNFFFVISFGSKFILSAFYFFLFELKL